MVEVFICFVFIISVTSVNALQEQKDPTVLAKINTVASRCADSSSMSTEQIESAMKDIDINLMSSCFFKCYLNHYGVIRHEDGNDTVNVPALLIFVKLYIPEISFFDLLFVAGEAMVCARDFEKNTVPDDQPGCLKTKALVSCLAKKDVLIKAFWLATRS